MGLKMDKFLKCSQRFHGMTVATIVIAIFLALLGVSWFGFLGFAGGACSVFVSPLVEKKIKQMKLLYLCRKIIKGYKKYV